MDAGFWNERYAAGHYVYGEAPNAFLAEACAQIPAGPVLCLAEGEGRNAVHLAHRGHRVTAVDLSPVGLDKAARLATKCGVEIATVHADLADYAIEPGAWAGIVAIFAHVPPSLRQRLHREAVAGLRPGGIFILEAYAPAQLGYDTGGPKVPELLMSLEDLRSELEGLELLVAREIEREVTEGVFHTGRGAVVQLVGRKSVLQA
jgi:SAM-dependent methyltransferase